MSAVPAHEDRRAATGSALPPSTLVFCGFSKLPANATLPQSSGAMAIEIEVDPYDMRIVDAACTYLPALGQKFLTQLLVGKTVESGLLETIEDIRRRYFSVTQRALIAAIEDLLRQFRDFQRKLEEKK